MSDPAARIDDGSPTWSGVREWAEVYIQTCHLQLEQTGPRYEDRDAEIRGRIAGLRDLLRLVDPVPPNPRIGSST